MSKKRCPVFSMVTHDVVIKDQENFGVVLAREVVVYELRYVIN